MTAEAKNGNGDDFPTAFRKVLPRLKGIYALVALSADAPETLVAALVRCVVRVEGKRHGVVNLMRNPLRRRLDRFSSPGAEPSPGSRTN